MRTPQELAFDELSDALEMEGYVRGTPLFDRTMKERRVEKCRELKRFATCGECPIAEECDIRLQYLRTL